jgi:GT2 family glycosyltransferase
MKLSVVVPVHNGGADLLACLAALARSSRPADEIIVVDDGSTDDGPRCASDFSAKVVPVANGPRGPAVARNHGAARATGDLLVFVDADVEVHADTLARFEQLFGEEPTLAAAFGSYDDQPSAPGRVSRYKNLLHHYVHQHGAGEAETFWAGCGAIRRDVFSSVDGFSASFRRPSVEDIELGARLRAAGHLIRLAPEIQCTHRKCWTLGSLLRADIFARAVPWTRLILQQGRVPSGLNTDRKTRWSAALAGLLILSVGVGCARAVAGDGPVALAAAGLAAASAAGLAWLNRALYRFFMAHGNLWFGFSAIGLHILYLLYSSAVFVLMLGAWRLTGGTDEGETSGQAAPSPPAPPSALRKHVAGFILFAALFAIYVGDGDPLPGGDATPNVHLAVTLLARGTLTYTPEADPFFFRWTVVQGGEVRSGKFRSWDERVDGQTMREHLASGTLRAPTPYYYLSATTKPGIYVSSYGAATGLFALPFVAAVYPFVDHLPERTELLWFLSKLAASFAVAASAWFLFLVAADHLRLSSAILLTLGYGLATCVWSVSSQALWQHAPGEFFLALGMFCLFRRKRRFAPAVAGLAFGLAFLCRPTNIMAVLAGFLVLLADRRALVRYLAGGLPVAVVFFAYNLHYFDKLIAFGQVTALAARVARGNTAELWKIPFAKALAGLLLSPARGLFVYSPIFVVSVWGGFRVWKERRWLPLRVAVLGALGILLVTARWRGWWGGWCYGYRLLVDMALLLAFVAIPVVEKLRARRGLTVLVGVLALWSVGTQALGAFVYDVGGWNGKQGFVAVTGARTEARPYFSTSEEAAAYCRIHGCSYAPASLSVDQVRYNARLWGIRDNPILHYLQNLKQARQSRIMSLQRFLLRDG